MRKNLLSIILLLASVTGASGQELPRHCEQERDIPRGELALWLSPIPQLLVRGCRWRRPSQAGVLRQQPCRLLVHSGQCGTGTALPQARPLRELRRLAIPVGTERGNHRRQHSVRHLRLIVQEHRNTLLAHTVEGVITYLKLGDRSGECCRGVPPCAPGKPALS